jgi:arylsulfatase A-like enzyme
MKRISQSRSLIMILPAIFILLAEAYGQKDTAKISAHPNVIFVLADDQGYGDIAINGNPWIKTPNMDRLARDGIQFTDFHVETTCAPTRAGLMTGIYCNKVGVWHTVKGRSILEKGAVTVAQMFKSAGYTTGIFGKWHLGDNYLYRPQDRGFDYSLVCRGGGVGQSPDYWNNDYFGDAYYYNGNPKRFKKYCNEVWFDNAIKFIEKAKKSHKPFFCYIPTNVPHEPYHVPQQYIDMYKDNSNIPFPAFYGMLTNLDENIGRLRKKLKELGIADNTIFIYSSDNGTSGGVKFLHDGKIIGYNSGMRGRKGSPYDGGHREPLFIYWKNGHITGGKSISMLTSYVDIVPSLLDLCEIPSPKNVHFNGQSIKPLIEGKEDNWPDRILFTDTQREEFLQKWKDACVMTNQWRLVIIKNEKELYDIDRDPGEKNNIASTYPNIVRKLSVAYENYWSEISTDSAKYERIVIGVKEHPQMMELSSMDCHMVDGIPAWNQVMVRNGAGEVGFWALQVATPGKYVFHLRRYPVESGLTINAAAPKGDTIPGGQPYPEGKSLHIDKAIIEINGLQKEEKINEYSYSVDFTLDLKKGPAQLKARFIDTKGNQIDAYYVYIKKSG